MASEARRRSSSAAGHNGLVAAAYLAKAGQQVAGAGARRARSAGSSATSELAPGFTAPGLVAHGRAAACLGGRGSQAATSTGSSCSPRRSGCTRRSPTARAVTFWADAARTAEGLARGTPQRRRRLRGVRQEGARDRELPRVRRRGDAARLESRRRSPTRSWGSSSGRRSAGWVRRPAARRSARCRWRSPTSSQEVVRGRGGPRARSRRAASCTRRWARGRPGPAAVLLNDSAGNDGGAAGSAVRGGRHRGARRRAAPSAAALGVRDPDRRRGRRDPHRAADAATGVALAGGERDRRARLVVSGRRSEADRSRCATRWRSGRRWCGGREHPQPGATAKVDLALSGPAGVPRWRRRAAGGRIVIGPSIDDVERAIGRREVRPASPRSRCSRPRSRRWSTRSLAPEGKHVMSVVFQAAPVRPARRRLGRPSATASATSP